MKKKPRDWPRGNPTAGVVTRLQQAQAIKSRRPAAVIASNASKELEALAARKLALATAHVLPGALRRSIAKICMPKRKSERGFFYYPY